MSAIKPSIFKNSQSGNKPSIAKVAKNALTGDHTDSLSKLSSDLKKAASFSRNINLNPSANQNSRTNFDANFLNSLTAGSGDLNLAQAHTTWSQNAGTVGVSGLDYRQTSLVSAATAKNLGALPGSARPDIFDDKGFGPGQKNFREIWGQNNGLGHGKSGGGYGAYDDFIANVVKPQLHDKPPGSTLSDQQFKQASTNLGFLFKDGEQLDTALKHTIGKLDETHSELGEDMWSTSFLTANGISKEAANGEVGDFLLSDKKYLDGIPNEQVGVTGNALEKMTHELNEGRMAELLSGGQEDFSLEEVSFILKDKAGIEGDNKFFAGSARGFIETAKNFEFLDNFDENIKEAQAKNPELAGEKAKFNINISFLPYSGADSGAFPSVIRGHEFGQQSKLKDSGISFDPEKPNQLSYMINNEKQLEALLGDIQKKFAGNDNVTMGKLQFDFHRHGGEDGSSLTGNALAKDNGNNEGASFAVNDANNFSGKEDGDIYNLIGKIAGENGADVNICGDSCHSGNHTDLIKDDVAQGIKDGQKAAGRDETLKLSVVDNAEAPGYTPAQNLKSHQGYMTSKFDKDGAAGLEFVMSNSSLAKTRRDDLYINKDTDVNKLDSARSTRNAESEDLAGKGSEQGENAMKDYVAQAEKNIDTLMARRKAPGKVLGKNDNIKEANSALADSSSTSATSSLTNNSSSDISGSNSNSSDDLISQLASNNNSSNAANDSSSNASSEESNSSQDLISQLAKKEPEQKKPEENTATT